MTEARRYAVEPGEGEDSGCRVRLAPLYIVHTGALVLLIWSLIALFR